MNFAVGPVQSDDAVRRIGSEQVPYFRTGEFSERMLENERRIKMFAKAEPEARVVFLTGSGTAAMEAAVANAFTQQDKVLVVDGGSFGRRFVELCQIYCIPYTEIRLDYGQALTEEQLLAYRGKGYTGFLVNVHETSTGVLYDMDMIGAFCRENHLFLIADAIGSFLADPFDMQAAGTDIMIASSQKALACPPGISFLVLSPAAVERIESHPVRCMYLDLKNALRNGQRGQTPFTPAVGILLQIHARLEQIEKTGGVEAEIQRTMDLAQDFREKIQDLPLEITSAHLSNAMTPLHPLHVPAYSVFEVLKDAYEIWVCPNGGDLEDKLFRVGHIGALTKADNARLMEALQDMVRRGLL